MISMICSSVDLTLRKLQYIIHRNNSKFCCFIICIRFDFRVFRCKWYSTHDNKQRQCYLKFIHQDLKKMHKSHDKWFHITVKLAIKIFCRSNIIKMSICFQKRARCFHYSFNDLFWNVQNYKKVMSTLKKMNFSKSNTK